MGYVVLVDNLVMLLIVNLQNVLVTRQKFETGTV